MLQSLRTLCTLEEMHVVPAVALLSELHVHTALQLSLTQQYSSLVVQSFLSLHGMCCSTAV
jgi:hypothetical protein